VNVRSYTLDSTTLAAGAAGIEIFEAGRTNLTIDLGGIGDQYFKFVVDFGDNSNQAIIQDTSDIRSLSAKSLDHIFHPTKDYISTYTVDLSGFKTDMSVDLYRLNVRIGQSTICAYRNINIINSHLYSTADGTNNLMMTIEAEDPRFVGNLIIPYNKDLDVYLPTGPPLQSIDTGTFLRTELYTPKGGLEAIVTEGPRQAYMIREDQLIVYVVGTEFTDGIIIHIDSHARMTDINGAEIQPELILIPEFSENYPEHEGLPYR
jgi:hypothetical protein